MKKFKKMLAVMLATIMMLTALPVTTAFAEEVYEQLTLGTEKSVRVKGDEVALSFTPEKDGDITIMDSTKVQLYVAKIIDKL